ncbi:MAG: TIGR00282 family metallophosphoesterase [Candidatus Margulisbacteria bacterium]|nr:TIGR00282 family metallophosphoesterase [Candidatus Margulisiibacteriota bacterium]MBU1617667.1 TIGR00282 family metallophosphoesterase [Candidatus Margulisiibacteriota bacterium]MBU1866860.1 TIGR00282 family metallophosphoesterase [Candidatus Margulisiibacteriota bacterium]
MSQDKLTLLFIGDIVGAFGRSVAKRLLPDLKKEFAVDVTIANGENCAHGFSITEKIYNDLLNAGVDAFTMGNHVWEKKEVVNKASLFEKMARPANYPPGTPGKDHVIIDVKGIKLGLLNLNGRVFMQCMDCPFQAAERVLPRIKEQTNLVLVDFHGEASSEKCAMGYFLDSKVSAIVGTHTHVQTADERILTGGTAFITDVGMTGPMDSIIGMRKEQVMRRIISQMPERLEPANEGPGLFNGVVITLDVKSGKALEIERIKRVTEPLNVEEN